MNDILKIVTLFLLTLTAEASSIIIPAPPQLTATGYLLLDSKTGKVLVEHNAEQRLPPASLTKIMTSYVVAKKLAMGSISLRDEVDVSVRAWRMEGSRMFIREGTKVGLEDLIKGVVIQSGNDASAAVAEHISGSEEDFAILMNQYAMQLGMENTNYVNSSGLPHDNHFTTANDLAKLSIALINEFPEHYSIYKERSFTYGAPGEEPKRQFNRNSLLFRDNSVDGIKTGHTDAAGYCLVASAVRGDMRLISVLMGASSEGVRSRESQKLLTYGFRYFETAQLYKSAEVLKQVRVWGGKDNSIQLGLSQDLLLTIPRGSRDNLEASINLVEEIYAPFNQGDEFGTLKVTGPEGDEITIPLQALNSVKESNFFSSILDSIILFFLKLFGGDPFKI